jgi:prepilin-type N-terminal cleavage/methylation domain-containing protein
MERARITARGVTLIELLVVLAILGIALALAGPATQKAVERFALNSSGHQLVSAFRQARHEARLGQREVLGKLLGDEFVLMRGDQRLKGIKLPKDVEVESSERQIAYSFLPSGQILGPERIQLISGGRYHGALILGPPPGTVRFEMSGANASPAGRSHQEMR